MSLRNKLFLSTAIIIMLSIILSGIIFVSTQYINKKNEAVQKADKTVKDIFQLTILLNEYFIHHEDRAAIQWEIKYKSLQKLLASQKYDDPRNQALLNNIVKTHASTAEDFSRLKEAYKNKSSPEIQNRLTEMLITNFQSMVTRSVTLSNRNYTQEENARLTALIALSIVITLLVISSITLFILLYKSIAVPIAKLNKATKLISEGNWDHQTDIKSKDELGQLAQSFNSMATKINSYITHQKQSEQQKDDFIAAASHELKTPLTSLTLYTQILSSQASKSQDAQTTDTLKKMNRQTEKLLNLINDLLDVQKIEGGKIRYEFDYFNINELISEIAQDLQTITTQQTIVIEQTKDISVYGSRNHIAQVLTNLLANAIKYTPSNAEIKVNTTATETDTIVSIQDSGIGIKPDDQQKIFERFYRVETGKAKTYPGLGLGLYISSQIILQHKGKIWVESQPNHGSTFFFSIPRVNP